MFKGCSKCGTQNPGDARFCGHCGASLEVEPGSAPPLPAGSRRPLAALWLTLGAAVFVLAACGAWWLNAPRPVATPSFDAAPPPSVYAASAPTAPAPSPPAEALPRAPSIAATAAPAAAAPPSSDLWEPAGREAVVDDTVAAKARQVARLKAERDARTRALREQRALVATRADADADAARHRLDEARARGVPPAAAATRSSAPTPTVATPAAARSVQERCVNLNIIAKAICQSRECVRAEHAGEPVCQRIRAADDRRREQ